MIDHVPLFIAIPAIVAAWAGVITLTLIDWYRLDRDADTPRHAKGRR